MFCSSIIPTVGRSSLQRAVESVLSQSLPPEEFEVIVVNDSGRPLQPAPWQQSPRVRVVTTMKRERCVARNTGAALARGDYLHFLDDDDWLAPGALAALRDLAGRNPEAGILYGATQLVDRQEQPVIQLFSGLVGNCSVQVMAGEWIPLQSSLIKTGTFFAAGGFNTLIPGPEDIDLLRRITLQSDVASSQVVISWVAMGQTNSTTDYVGHASKSRFGREQALNNSGTFSRLRAAAVAPQWQGRLVRIYATSAVWNAQHHKWLTALSRALAALAAIVLAGTALAKPEFWRSVRTRYDSETFRNGFEEAGHNVAGQRPSERTAQS